MNNDSVTHEDWGFFGLRWVVLVVITLVFWSIYNGERADIVGVLLAVFFLAAVLNIAFLVLVFYPRFRRFVSLAILLGDWTMLGLYIGLGLNPPIVLMAIGSTLMLTAALQLNYLWTMIHAVGVIGISLSNILMAQNGVGIDQILVEMTVPLTMLVGAGVLSVSWAYVREQSHKAQKVQTERLARRSKLAVDAIRERNRVISAMTVTLSSTLNPDKVLQAALEAGQVGVHPSKRGRLVSVALLFRNDGAMHVAASHGLTRSDLENVVPGQAGIVGRAIKIAEPVFAKDARRDPELQYFAGLQDSRSLLCIPLHANYDNFGVLLYGSTEAEVFNREDTDLLMAISTQATLALHNAVLYRNLSEEKERIVEVEEDARKKLARDLHDGPTQNVSAIAMRMSYIYRLLERRPDEVPAELKKVEDLARKTTKEIRDMLFTLRPLVLESQGLAVALDQLCEKTLETHGQHVVAQVTTDAAEVLDAQQQGVIFYIVEEAVGNARKHAEAELISIEISRQGDVVVVEIADNGVGFDADAVNANYDQRGSLGMVNMRERTELLDGTLRIDSAEGQGTTITIIVPIKTHAAHPVSRRNSNSRPMVSPRP
jgi:signal transduction histidine kinase